MENNLGVASQVFGYLKKTVAGLADPYLSRATLLEDVKGRKPNASLSEQFESSQRSQIFSGSKRKDHSTVSTPITKRQKIVTSSNSQSIVASEGNTVVLCLNTQESSSISVCYAVDQNKDPAVQLNSIFSQLLWTLKYLKLNTCRTNKEMMEMTGTLCEGLEKVVVLSRLNFTDREFKRFMRIANSLFCLIKSYDEENSVLTTIQINQKIDHVFDHFLDRFTEESSAEGHLKSYGFICTLIHQVTQEEMIKKFADKLIFRLYITATTLWRACVSRPHGLVQLVDQDDINLFFYYCQLLEVIINASTSGCQIQLRETVYQSLTALEEDCGSLFTIFPNLAMILLSTIFVTSLPLKTNTSVSPLKESNPI